MDPMRLPVEPAFEESGVGAPSCQEEMEGSQVQLLTSRRLTQSEAARCHNRKHRIAGYLEICYTECVPRNCPTFICNWK